MKRYYLTKSGVLVFSCEKPSVRGGYEKVPCFRAATNGWHGWLKLRNLQPSNRVGGAK